jgi:hypothetical protein
MLALSAWLAIKDAISAVADHKIEPRFSLPATNEVILLSSEELRLRVRQIGRSAEGVSCVDARGSEVSTLFKPTEE